MDNKILEDIKNYAHQRLQAEYGFVEVAEGDKMAMLNSGKTTNITVKIQETED